MVGSLGGVRAAFFKNFVGHTESLRAVCVTRDLNYIVSGRHTAERCGKVCK